MLENLKEYNTRVYCYQLSILEIVFVGKIMLEWMFSYTRGCFRNITCIETLGNVQGVCAQSLVCAELCGRAYLPFGGSASLEK